MTQDIMAYQRAYELWRGDAVKAGYGSNLRTVDVLTTAEFATTDNGTQKSKQFFNPSDTNKGNPLLNTTAPSFKEGGNVPSSSIYGIYGMMLLIDNQLTSAAAALTVTQLNQILAGIGSARLTANIGNQPFAEWQASRCLQSFDSGYLLSNDGAATPLVARGNFIRSVVTPLPTPKLLNPGAQLSGTITYTLPTISAAFNLTLLYHMFAADQGSN